VSSPDNAATPLAAPPWQDLAGAGPKITRVRTILTAPENTTLVVVKIETSEPELYGLGCATFTQRWKAVQTFIDEHLARLLVGR
jgi:mannonate dehydratase